VCEGGEQLSENETNESVKVWQGIEVLEGMVLGLRKDQAQTHKVENGAYNNQLKF